MIDVDLATRLRAAGLPWRPSDGDRFMIPGGELAEDVFVVAEMVIQVQDVPGGASVFKFNGTTEWALDSIDATRVLWLPREEQLRDALGEQFQSLAAVPGGFAVTLTNGSRHLDIDAERAYARAVLHVLGGAVSVLIGHRFRGPNTSGNGGYSAGAVASALGLPLGPAEVTLLSPPPLDARLGVTRDDDAITVSHGTTTVATARPAALELEIPEPPSFAEAARAASACPWLVDHPYPQCFVCGTERPDGLHIFPGPVAGRRIAAAPWVPDASVCEGGLARPEVVWAAIDCPSLFGYGCFDTWDGLMLLGRFTARVYRTPRQGERCVVTGWALGRDGRKYDTAAALHGADGELLATSRALWITLKDER